MATERICIRCHQRLKDQRRWHSSTMSAYVREGTEWERKHGRRWCDGPTNTPGDVASQSRLPVHYRDFGESQGVSVCGLKGGVGHDVTWHRIKVILTAVTCEACLTLVIQRCKKQLHARLERLKADGTPIRKLRPILKRAHGQRTWAALKVAVKDIA